jgi:multidrug resistance efflux pump
LVKIFVFAALVLLLAAAALHVLNRPRPRLSTSAVLEGTVREISAPFSGEILFVAAPGQAARTGESLLKISVVPLARSLEETRKKAAETAAALPEVYRAALAELLALAEEERQAASAAMPGEDELRRSLEEATAGRAALSLRLRRLELKKSKSAQEVQELNGLRAEEKLSAERVRQAYADYEQARLRLDGRKKQAVRREYLLRALQSAPAHVREGLELLEPLLAQAQELKTRLDGAEVKSVEAGLVLRTARREGETAQAGETVLFFLAGAEDEIQLTAYFPPEAAAGIAPGDACLVETGGMALPGEIRRPLPYVFMGAHTSVPFRLGIPLAQLKNFTGFDPGAEITVRMRP